MRDNFKKARAQARYGRLSVTNGQARARVKMTEREAMACLEQLMIENRDVLIRLKNS